MRDYPASDPASPTLVLAHGAGAGEKHPWMVRVGKGLAARGIHVVTFNFPYMDAGKSVPDSADKLEQASAAAWAQITAARRGPFFAGGKSMGGRIASQVAARNGFTPAPAGLVFFGYPLHPPGKPQQRRDKHLPAISPPMLFLHGERDPFGSPAEMTGLVEPLAGSTLHLVPGGDHSLVTRKKAGPEGDTLEKVMDKAAEWMRQALY
jgi:predicted alpha/beta-hydrolase family hydrolase